MREKLNTFEKVFPFPPLSQKIQNVEIYLQLVLLIFFQQIFKSQINQKLYVLCRGQFSLSGFIWDKFITKVQRTRMAMVALYYP